MCTQKYAYLAIYSAYGVYTVNGNPMYGYGQPYL